MQERLGFFLIFIILSVVTLGIYPVYFYVTRMEEQVEQTKLLREILKEMQKSS